MTIRAIDSAMQGMRRAAERVERSAASIASGSDEGENTVRDIVDLKVAELEYDANAVVVKRLSDLQRSVIDLLA